MEGFCDLHTHSHFSDGTYSPAQLIDAAEGEGLAAIALCDHNTVSGLPEFLDAAKGRAPEAVPGAEFSTEYRGTEVHILGLFLKPCHYPAITARMEQLHRRKELSNIALAEALNRAGYVLDYAHIKETTFAEHPNRAHIAAELTRLGYTASIQEAFATLLAPGNGYYQPPERPDALDTVAFIKSLGAVAVLAHPFLNLKTEELLRGFLEQAKARGLDAMETRYSTFDEAMTRGAVALAEEFDLLQSGGSDFHGDNKPHIRLGKGQGNLSVPAEFLEKLREAAL